MMNVGREFSSWESFTHSLDQYSKENKVGYTIGLCKPVEKANKNENVQLKFPVKFKFCFARVLFHKNAEIGERKSNQKASPRGCGSSIFVSVNKKRTALVIREVDLKHIHDAIEDVFSGSGSQGLQGEEQRQASVLLLAGVALPRVQEFMRKKGGQSQDAAFLNDLDLLMAEDSGAIVEITNFDLSPQALYLQTSRMRDRLTVCDSSKLQIVSYPVNEGEAWVVSVISVDSDMSPCLLCVGVSLSDHTTAYNRFVEAFVKNNSLFCDSITGAVLDCRSENMDFVQQLLPQADLAWSRTFITDSLTEVSQSFVEEELRFFSLFKDLMNAESQSNYESTLKEVVNTGPATVVKEFLNNWDSRKEWWMQYEISKSNHLRHQKCCVEHNFVKMLKPYVKSSINLSGIISALLHFDREEAPGSPRGQPAAALAEIDPSCRLYAKLCLPEAFRSIECQIAIALNSKYEIKEQTDMILIKRLDSDDEFILDLTGDKCTCPFYIDSQLPCQHIFAWLKRSGRSLYNESLVPAKWQVFGTTSTLDAIAESLDKGRLPSSLQHDEKVRELQSSLKDILSSCSSHSFYMMSKDLLLLKQVHNVIRTSSAHEAKVSVETKVTTAFTPEKPEKPKFLSQIKSSTSTPVVRRRGRPTNKERLLRLQENRLEIPEPVEKPKPAVQTPAKPPVSKTQILSGTSRHNLRRNIKHKFITRDLRPTLDDEDSDMENGGKKFVSSVINDDGTEIFRVINPCRTEKIQRGGNFISRLVGSDLEDILKVKKKKSRAETDESDDDTDDVYNSSSEKGFYSKMEDSEDGESRMEKKKEEIHEFMQNVSTDVLQRVMQSVSMLESPEEREQEAKAEQEKILYPADVLIQTCQKCPEVHLFIEKLSQMCPGYEKFAFQVGAAILCKSFQTGAPVEQLLETISPWPSHLPELSTGRCFEDDITLDEKQVLTVCGYKLGPEDMSSLQPGGDVTSSTLHAYLEILAQKHSGKMFVLPFNIVHKWRQGSYSDIIFPKVHFKTFEYLVLPIHCGADLTETDRAFGIIMAPCWMALVADVKNKTVGILNPRTEDRYLIAANGYMLQWRRYMQIRCVHTKEMLSSWSTKRLECNKMDGETLSGVMLLMNVEALLNGVTPVVMTSAHVPRYLRYVASSLRDTDRETTVLCVGGPDCQQLAARDADWIQCENCRAWWHRTCSDVQGENAVFYCTSCQTRIHNLGQSLDVAGDSATGNISILSLEGVLGTKVAEIEGVYGNIGEGIQIAQVVGGSIDLGGQAMKEES